jgi:hypothetical protein
VTSSPITIDVIVAGTLLVAVLIVFVVLVLRRIRERRRRLTEDLAADRQVLRDRAFNSIRLATAEAAVLSRDGIDVSAVRYVIGQAESALNEGDPYRALTMGRTAHDTLVRLRREGTLTPPGATRRPEPLVVEPDGGGSEPPPAPTLPKNLAAARFQLRLLAEEIDDVGRREPTRPGFAEARELQSGAHAALDRGEDATALRLALQGRRSIGAHIESLPPPSDRPAPVPLATSPASEGAGAAPAVASTTPAGPRNCPKCGKPSKAPDVFCRYCGAAVRTAHCPRCRAELEAEDRFCSRCGSPVGG